MVVVVTGGGVVVVVVVGGVVVEEVDVGGIEVGRVDEDGVDVAEVDVGEVDVDEVDVGEVDVEIAVDDPDAASAGPVPFALLDEVMAAEVDDDMLVDCARLSRLVGSWDEGD